MEKEVTDLKDTTLKILGIVASVIGIGANVLAEVVSEKRMDTTIEKKVQKAISKTSNKV